MHEKDVNELPIEVAIALGVGGVVFAIFGVVWGVVTGAVAAVAAVGGVVWFLNQ